MVYANNEKESMGEIDKYVESHGISRFIVKEKTQISQLKEEPRIVYSEIGRLVRDTES